MTKIEVAQRVADKKYQEYLQACQRVKELIADEEVKVRQQAEKVRLAAEERIKTIKSKIDAVRTPAVQKMVAVAINAERETLGLSNK